MIADLDESIRQLLVAEIPIKNGEIDISFDQPKREWSARINRPTVNLFLYDLRENPTLRNHQWEQLPANGKDHTARLKRSPLRLDCFYMLTAWAADPEDEHRLLSRCLTALFRNPILPKGHLVGSMQNQPFDIAARLANHDKLTNPAEVWSALDNELRPTVSYILSIALDPWRELVEPVVRSLVLRTGQAAEPERLTLAQPATDLTRIGGTVRAKGGEHPPVAGVTVAIKNTGWLSQTDASGRYTLGMLPNGTYTLIAWPQEGRAVEKEIQLPSEEGDYDLVLD